MKKVSDMPNSASAPPPPAPWSEGFVTELAVVLESGETDVSDTLTRYQISKDDFFSFARSKVFVDALSRARREVVAEGVTFRAKARAQAEALLGTSWGIVHDENAPFTVKADLIKATVRWAGLEPERGGVDKSSPAQAVQVVINIPDVGEPKPLVLSSVGNDA